VRKELTEQFGGLTVYRRAPAEGTWKLNENHTSSDDIVIFEVMAAELDEDWWRRYRKELESRFRARTRSLSARNRCDCCSNCSRFPMGSAARLWMGGERGGSGFARGASPQARRLQLLRRGFAQRPRKIVLHAIKNTIHKAAGIWATEGFRQLNRLID